MARRIGRRWLWGIAVPAVAVAGWLVLTERPLAIPVSRPETDVPLRIYGLGTVEARIVSQVGSEVDAALTEVLVDSGDAVIEGQVMARFHAAEQEARVARAEAAVSAAAASLTRAEATVARARAVLAQHQAANERRQALVARDAASAESAEETRRDFDVASADLDLAEAEVEVTRAQAEDAAAALQLEQTILAHHELRAPFDGVVVERHAEAGAVLRAGDAVLTLMDPSTVWVLAYIDEERAGALALGQSAEIRLRSLPQRRLTGRLARIGLESDRVNEERRVWIVCVECPPRMYLGEQAEAMIAVGRLDQALMVPEVAIRGFDGDRGRVWTVQDGRFAEVELAFGAQDERGRVEVTSGLPEGAQIVAAPVAGAEEGRRARIAEAVP